MSNTQDKQGKGRQTAVNMEAATPKAVGGVTYTDEARDQERLGHSLPDPTAVSGV